MAPAGDHPPAGVRAALASVIGEVATAYTASALASGRNAPAASVIGTVVAAACSGGPAEPPATSEATSVAPVPCWAWRRTSACVPSATASSGTASVELVAIARMEPNVLPGVRVATRTLPFSVQVPTAVPSDSSASRGRSALPRVNAGATRTGAHTPPLAAADAGESASRAVATMRLRRRIDAV